MTALFVILAFLVGLATGGLFYLTATDPEDEDLSEEMRAVRHEVAVIFRVLEEAGIRFNRDYQRNVTGVVHDLQAELLGKAEVS